MNKASFKLSNRRAQRKQSSLFSLFPPVQIAFLVCLAVTCKSVRAECYVDPLTGQRFCTSPKSAPSVAPSSAHCRITVGDGSTGSGTLIARDANTGTVLTCSHLFDNGDSNIVVAFSSGGRFAARLIERDQAHDLAALLIRRPKADAADVAGDGEEPSGTLSACGYGSDGQFRCVRGEVVGQAMSTGATYPSLTIRGAVRPGDSGGGVLNARGHVVGVVWGVRDGLTYATCGRPVREFVRRVLRQEVRGKSREPEGKPIADSSSPSPQVDWKAWSDVMESRLRALDEKKQDKGEYLQAGDLNSLRTTLHERIDERVGQVLPLVEAKIGEHSPGAFAGISIGKLVVGALGLSGPLAAAVVVGAALMGRRWKRGEERGVRDENKQSRSSLRATRSSPIAVDTPPPPQRTVPETHYVPFEVDSFAKAHQWASEQVARKYPGATEILHTQDSMIKQFLAAK